ncbi:hypothetical protein KP509_06G016400 [Ceratopteris richardii]|uniref:RING-type domain-containing protein n=1 Tax=Ceratopteris richardii TaxID=49495 RepID=A0A8T2UG12_CERRI|nr:hypothetical protein KP509_06G016400 [Ceratopteris richardii]
MGMTGAQFSEEEGFHAPDPKSWAMASCSVCLDAVVEGEGRSNALLKCGHIFHLDCIGSAFNAKGRMQCPNCRNIEPGQWLYADPGIPRDSVEEAIFQPEIDLYNSVHESHLDHQGSFEHISLTFEELTNSGDGYFNPIQVPGQNEQICPFLEVQYRQSHINQTDNPLSFRVQNLGHLNSIGTRWMTHARNARLSVPVQRTSWAPPNFSRSETNFYPYYGNPTSGVVATRPQFMQMRLGHRTNPGSLPGQMAHNRTDETTRRHSDFRLLASHSNANITSSRSMHGGVSGLQWEPVHTYVTYGVPAYWWTWSL